MKGAREVELEQRIDKLEQELSEVFRFATAQTDRLVTLGAWSFGEPVLSRFSKEQLATLDKYEETNRKLWDE